MEQAKGSDREVFMRASFLQKNLEELEGQNQMIKQQILELGEFRECLKSFISSGGKEMLSPLGRGVFAKTDVKEKELFVEVGSGVIVKKAPQDTLKVVEEQIEKLNEVRLALSEQFESNLGELQSLMSRIEEVRAKESAQKQ